MRSITFSECSNTLRLPENELQLLAGALDSHLQRRDARPRQPRHFVVLEVLDVLEEERLAVFRRESGERPADGVVPLRALGRAGERSAGEGRVVPHEQPPAPRRTRAGGPAPVDQDTVQPRAEPLRNVAAGERAIPANEGVLQCLLRVFAISEHVHGVAAQTVAVACDERSVRTGVAGADPAHQLSVARPHVVYTQRLSHDVTVPRSCDAGQRSRGIWGRAAHDRPRSQMSKRLIPPALAAALLAGGYPAIRMRIDTSRSSVVWKNGSQARVNWQNWSGSEEEPLYALVEYPVNVSTQGAEIIIDFDVGRSFLYNFYGAKEFILMPQIRAINSAATGTIAGSVTSDYTGATRPIANANVTLCGGAACEPPNAYIVATSRSDSAGRYAGAFVRAGSYTVRVEQPDYPFLNPVIVANVTVSAGDTTRLAGSLPKAGSGRGAYVRISGPTSVGVGGTISLNAAVGDAGGNPVVNPAASWASSNSAIAQVTGVGDTASVIGRAAGYATITAASGQLSDTLRVQVLGSAAPVASVTVVPASASLAVGDSVGFRAELRDAAGALLTDRAVSWVSSDRTVISGYPYGPQALVRPRAAGGALLRATSEGKTGQATITVH